MIRSFQWDLARQVERLDWLIAQLPRYAEWGYQEVHLHLEDAVEFPSLPGIARRDAYTYRQFGRLVDAAARVGIKVVPIVNLLGHTQYLIKVPELRDLNELRAPDGSPLDRGQICPLHPRTLEIADKLLHDVAPFCTAGKVHVGLDESFHLGKHPLSKAEISEIGLAAHFSGYVNRLHALVRSLDLRMAMWADMLCFIPEAIPLLPKDLVAYDWYYYPFRRLPRIELFNFASYDLAKPLQAHGIEYWGCAMNGSFRYEPLPIFGDRMGNIQSWWRRCKSVGAGGMLVSSWEPHRLALEMTTVVDAAAACLWLGPDTADHSRMLAKGFERALKLPRRGALSVARTALRCDRHSFAGYARWEINERWDCTSPREDLDAYQRGQRHYDRLVAKKLPESLAASTSFLSYLYARDLFVRRAARGVFKLRRGLASGEGIQGDLVSLTTAAAKFDRLLHEARLAGATMWLSTRKPDRRNPNHAMLAADAVRLRSWQQWLKRCARSPAIAYEDTPVVGVWQLQLTVHNFAPALQKIIIEEQQPAGTWKELRSRFTIEFSTVAATARARVRRELGVPIKPFGKDLPTLRVALRGLGQVRIKRVELSNGVTVLRPTESFGPSGKILGSAAPCHGLPELDWENNVDAILLNFR